MMRVRYVAWVFCVGVAIFGADVISAQDFPNKPIRIVTSGVGGGNDFAARLIAQGLLASLDHRVLVENRPGASGIIAAQTVSSASPDGHTLLLYSGSIWLLPVLRKDVPYDPVRDFAPITLAATSPNIVVVHPSLPVRSVKELIALAKARPGELNNAAGESGSTTHLAAELFSSMAGIKIVHVPYKSGAMRMADLIAGHVQLMFATAGSVTLHVKSRKLRALAVTSAKPSPLVPGLPTVAASGLPGYESESPFAIFAPAKTPTTTISRLNHEIVRVLNNADVKERFFSAGVETVGSSPEQLAATVKSEMTRMRKVIKDTGIRVD